VRDSDLNNNFGREKKIKITNKKDSLQNKNRINPSNPSAYDRQINRERAVRSSYRQKLISTGNKSDEDKPDPDNDKHMRNKNQPTPKENVNTKIDSARAAGIAMGLRVINGGKHVNRKAGKGKNTDLRLVGRHTDIKQTPIITNPFDTDPANIEISSIEAMHEAYNREHNSGIAVIDENFSILAKVVQALTSFGYDVRKYTNPFTALTELNDEPCKLLICTCRLKGISGIILADMIKTASGATHVLLLADKKDGNLESLIHMGHINGFMLKPPSKNELLDKVSILMDTLMTRQ
jgi:hypothetical protein